MVPPAGKIANQNGKRRLRAVQHREAAMRIRYAGFVAGIGLVALACAGAPAPTERLASAQSAVRAAGEVGAKDVPQAKLHAQLAQEQIDQATKLMEEGENERADAILRRAQADAELAVAMSRESTSQQQAEMAEAALRPTTDHPPSMSAQTTSPTTP